MDEKYTYDAKNWYLDVSTGDTSRCLEKFKLRVVGVAIRDLTNHNEASDTALTIVTYGSLLRPQ